MIMKNRRNLIAAPNPDNPCCNGRKASLLFVGLKIGALASLPFKYRLARRADLWTLIQSRVAHRAHRPGIEEPRCYHSNRAENQTEQSSPESLLFLRRNNVPQNRTQEPNQTDHAFHTATPLLSVELKTRNSLPVRDSKGRAHHRDSEVCPAISIRSNVQ